MTRRKPRTDADEIAAAYATRTPKAGGCPHPPTRLYGWLARNDLSPGSKLAPPGYVFCIACCACGAVLAGGADLEADDSS
jgi:hypothetical protein